MSLLLNILFRLVIAFLPRSKHLLISWLQSPSAVILEPPKIVSHCFHYFPVCFPWSDGTGCHDLCFWMLSFKSTFSLSSFTFIKRLFSSSLSAIRGSVICVSEKAMAPHSSTPAWKIHGQRSLVGYSPWGCKESDMTEWLHFTWGSGQAALDQGLG